MRLGTRDIGLGLMCALAMTDPFGGVTLIIMTIAGHAIAVRTERDTVLIIAALEASEGELIAIGVAEANGAQGVEILMHILKDLIKPFTRIPEEFTDLESGKTFAQTPPDQGWSADDHCGWPECRDPSAARPGRAGRR